MSSNTLPLATSYRPDAGRQATLLETLARFPNGVPRPEYPRPRLYRESVEQSPVSNWKILNGAWEFSFDSYDTEGKCQGLLNRWQDKALPDFCVVPFAPQWSISCKNEKQTFPIAWYARDFEVPENWLGTDLDVLLHFGACDYKTIVWVNGREAGHNQGGHVPFSIDITPFITAGENRVCLRVEDHQDPRQPRGKQAVSGQPASCDYWCTTGLWQSVWLESVPAIRIQEAIVTPLCSDDAAQDVLEVAAYLHAPALGWRVEVQVLDSIAEERGVPHLGETLVASEESNTDGSVVRLQIPLPNARRWSPDDPHLYGLRIRLFDGEQLLDEVHSYAGMRSIALRDKTFHLNGEPLYLQMVLDQGYWPDGGLTAPSDDDLKRDIELTKAFGFNGARKHQKVEDPRWLYHCDRMGLLVWGEMANARAWSPTAEEWFLAEWERVIQRDLSHPCVVAWVPINESWGVPDVEQNHPIQHAFLERAVALTRRLDPTRPIISNDGWETTDLTDIVGVHDYQTGDKLRSHWQKTLAGEPLPERTWAQKRIFLQGARYRGQPIMFTEIGGFLGVPDLPEGQWDGLYSFYNTARNPDELAAKYGELMGILAEFDFVSGWCYTQLTDIELEINGLLTYDRKPKVEPERIAALHRAMHKKWLDARKTNSTVA